MGCTPKVGRPNFLRLEPGRGPLGQLGLDLSGVPDQNRDMFKGGAAVGTALVIGGWAVSAHAQTAEGEYGDYEAPSPERRSGFTVGVSYGAAYLDAVGYPNKLSQIDDPAYRQTLSGFGTGSSLWLGGVLRDWLTFALGMSSRRDFDQQLAGGAFVFRVEGFPLFALGGAYRDVGVFGEFGAGGNVIEKEGEVVADAGFTSMLGLGAFYEPWTFWKFSSGPALQYTREFSQSMTVHAVTLGMRLNLYATQPD